MNQQTPPRETYDTVMLFYLVVGAGGLIFFLGSILSEFGWLEPAVRFVFGDKSDSVLEQLLGLGILFTFLLGFYLFGGWIPAIWIVIRFRKTWQIWAPSALFLVIEILFVVFMDFEGTGEFALEYVFGALFSVYFVATLLAGLWMKKQRRASTARAEN